MEGSSADEQGAGRMGAGGGWWELGVHTQWGRKVVVLQLRASFPVVSPHGSGSMRSSSALRPAFTLGVCWEWSP